MKYGPILTLILLFGCTPKVIVKSNEVNKSFASKNSDSTFIVFEKDTSKIGAYIDLGEIVIKDAGFSTGCDFESVKKIAIDKAKQLGANGLLILEHKTPDFVSTCHRIKSKAIILDNPSKYEKVIEWDENRKLQISDFKGSVENRPFIAATYSTISYSATPKGLSNSVIIKVQTIFDTQMSYFKNDTLSNYTLEHEQLHFDITEVYSRLFYKRIIEEVTNYTEFSIKHHSIFNEVLKDCSTKQDEYDTEVYSDITKQEKWNNWVEQQLKDLSEFKRKEIVMRMRGK